MSGTINFTVTHNGKAQFHTSDPNEAFGYILRNQGQSVHHATTYEGWRIVQHNSDQVKYANKVLEAREIVRNTQKTAGIYTSDTNQLYIRLETVQNRTLDDGIRIDLLDIITLEDVTP